MLSNDRHRVFKRMETDGEFRARLKARGVHTYESGKSLDDVAWAVAGVQRRIVEDTTDR